MSSRNVAEIILRARDEASKEIQGMSTGLGGLAKTAGVAAAAFVAFRAAQALIRGVAGQIASATEAAFDNIEANSRLAASLNAIGRLDAKGEIEATATELQRQGIMAGAAAEQLGAYIVNLTGAADKTPRLMQASADLSAALGVSTEAAAQRLARTLAGDLSPRLAQLVPDLRDLTEEQLRAGDAITIIEERFRGQAREVMTARDRIRAISGSYDDMRAKLVQATLENANFNAALDAVNNAIVSLTENIDGLDIGDRIALVIMDLSIAALRLGITAQETTASLRDKVEALQRVHRVASSLIPVVGAAREGIGLLSNATRDGTVAAEEHEGALGDVLRALIDQRAQMLDNMGVRIAQGDTDRRETEAEVARRRQANAELQALRSRNNAAIIAEMRGLSLRLIEDEETRIRQQFEMEQERVNALVASEHLKNAMIVTLEAQRDRELADLAARREAEEDARRQREEEANERHMQRLRAEQARAHEQRMREIEAETRAQQMQTAQIISLGEQAGAALVGAREDAFRRILVIVAREAAAHASRWVAETVPFPASLAIAPLAGGLMGAAVMALQNASFATGGFIGRRTGIGAGDARIVQAHDGEAILNAGAVRRIGDGMIRAQNAGTASIGGGGGDTFNIYAYDSRSIDMEMRDGGSLNRAFRRSRRRGD